MTSAVTPAAPWEKFQAAPPTAAAGPWEKFGTTAPPATPQTQEQIDKTMGSPSMWQQLMHGRGTDEESTKENLAATQSGLESVKRGVTGAIRGIGATFNPKPQPGENAITATPAGRMVRGIGSLAKQATEIPAAIHDIQASADPLGHYAHAAQDAAGEGAGQALTGLATEGLVRGIPPAYKAATNPEVMAAPVRLAARGAETAINQKLVPVRSLANIMTPADEAAETQFKVPGRDLGLRKPIPPTLHGPEAPPAITNAFHGPEELPITNAEHGPAAPPREVIQARGLQLGGRAIEDPAAGLGKIPVSASETPAPAAAAAEPLPDKIPTTSRSSLYKKLDQPLRESVGASAPPVRGVSLRNQPKTAAAAQPELSIPEGHTPAESTAVNSYKYDPATQELHIADKSGKTYVYPATPEEAAAFKNNPSKGKAWQDIRNRPGSSGRTATIDKEGIRTPYKPPESLRSASPESEAPGEITPLNQKLGNLKDFISPDRAASKSSGPRGVKVSPAPAAASGEGDLTGILQKSLDQAQGKGGVSTSVTPKTLLHRWGVDPESFAAGREQTRGMSPQDSAASIKKLTAAYKKGEAVEPVIEVRDADNNLIEVDGRGRALAAHRAGIDRIPVIVRRLQ